jgi:hypothetical protein
MEDRTLHPEDAGQLGENPMRQLAGRSFLWSLE